MEMIKKNTYLKVVNKFVCNMINKKINIINKIEKLDKKNGKNFVFFMVFTTAVLLRFFVVAISAKFSYTDSSVFVSYIFQDFLVFLASILSIWITLAYILRCKPNDLKYLMILASILVIMPPIIDLIATGGGAYWSFYINEDIKGLYPIFISFFDNLPMAVKYFGTKIMVFFSVLTVGVYVGFKTFKESKSIFKMVALSIFSMIIIYSIFFFYASFPSWFTFFIFAVFNEKFITSVTLANISELFITPHPLFHLFAFDIGNALLNKLNLIYPFIVMFLLLWKEKMDKNMLTLDELLKYIKKNFLEKLLNLLFISYVPIFFALLSFYNNAPYQELLFSFIYLSCVLILFGFLFVFFTIKTQKFKQMLMIFMIIFAFTVGYKILFLFLVMATGIYSMKQLNITIKSIYLIFSSLIFSFVFYIIFSPNQSFLAFPWYLLLYNMSTLIFLNILRKKISTKKIAISERVTDLILGLAIIINCIMSEVYILLEVLIGLFILLAVAVFFAKDKKVYYYFINMFIVGFLMFSLISAVVLANI